ncbi:hypothetical protein [Flavivirga sp. 57AJ16]|uniref:hypothetical protein n=1 Tax=Flavivirga sp. 57AJ16 TaxID=3025307 RepID=UPI00236728B2|nr:hypothetical protein [Flavivirga sp. 57AJ16]MDD7888191.1 hypothetical protein [Flavivirga sp. 57AJ16]
MELENIKSNWKNAGKGKRDKTELLKMTEIKNHPNIKKIRIKFIIEAVLLIIFLAVFYEGLDGVTKPLWANALLIVTTTTYIIVRFLGWLVLRNPIKEGNLKKSLISFHNKLKQMAILILLTSFLFGSAIISFFTSSINFTQEKYFVLAGMIITLLFLVYLSSRNWIKRIKGINETLTEFDDKAN